VDIQIPLWLAITFDFVAVGAVVTASGLVLLFQNKTFGDALRRQANLFEAQLSQLRSEQRADVQILKNDIRGRDEKIAELLDRVAEYESFMIKVGRVGLNNLVFNVSGDTNIAGDVAGRDKLTNELGRTEEV
jgi:hypothetical protein